MNTVHATELEKLIGDRIARIHRLRYQVGDEVVSNLDEGSVELVFSSGAVFYCESGPSGDGVRFSETPWVDPFAGPLSPENEEFVRTSGKWVKHDVSDEQPFAELINREVSDIAPMTGTKGKTYGLLVNLSAYLLVLYGDADELHVRLLN